jgi:hypothetical protein
MMSHKVVDPLERLGISYRLTSYRDLEYLTTLMMKYRRPWKVYTTLIIVANCATRRVYTQQLLNLDC